MNFATLQDMVTFDLALDSTDAVQLTRVKQAINAAMHEVEGLLGWRGRVTEETFALTGTSTKETIPTDFVSNYYAYAHDGTSGWPLQNIATPVEVTLYGPRSLQTRGKPARYCCEGGSFIVAPYPDTSYTAVLGYYATEEDMSADSDSPFFPATWHHILVSGAKRMLAVGPGYDPSIRSTAADDFRAGIEELLFKYGQPHDPTIQVPLIHRG